MGRVQELAELELAWRESASGGPALVLLGGESGIGKSRLLAELEAHVAAQGGIVLRGEGLDQGDAELPYAPLLGALRGLVKERHPVLEALSLGSRHELKALLPGLGDGRDIPEAREGSGQLRLFEALVELVGRLGGDQPLLLALEDMHWADRSTRMFVSFLVRSLRTERVMVLLTYRSDELHRRHPLRPLVSELERLDRARRIELEPLDRDELSEALSDILGADPTPELVARLFARSEGNPLYIEELLAAGLDGRGAAPQSLRDAFMLRIERLSSQAQAAVRTIAPARRLGEAQIAEMCGLPIALVQAALHEAVAEQVLVAGADGQIGFRHALLREVVLDDLLPGERRELHLSLARMFEAVTPVEPGALAEQAATIAGHYAAAGDQPAALRTSIAASQAASAVRAFGSAADLAEAALELWSQVGEAERPEGMDHAELLVSAAAAHAFGGERSRVEVLLQAALSELGEGADPLRRARILERLARTQWALNRGLQGIETAQRALAILPEDDTIPERAILLAWLARTRVLRGRLRDAVQDGERALRAAITAGDACAEAEVLNTLGMAQLALGQEPEGVARLRRAMEISREQEDLDTLSYAYANLADLLNLRGRTEEALRIAQEGLVEMPRWLGRSRDWMILTVSEMAFDSGDWKLAREHLGASPTQYVGTLLIFRLLREAELALGAGDEARAAQLLEQAEPLVAESSEPQWIGHEGSLLGELRRCRGDLEGARAAVSRALDRLELCTDDVMRIARLAGVGLRIEADSAQRARDLRDRAAERDAISRARLHMQRLAAAAAEGGPVEAAWKVTGAAELLRARGRGDVKTWLRAAVSWDAVQRPCSAALARFRGAEAALEAGEREAAGELTRGALRAADQIGAEWLRAEIIRLADRGRLTLAQTGDGRRAQDSAPDVGGDTDPFGLTPRERQVLVLLAQGATNRQIGATLYMAEKTASVHVSRILAKLEVSSRTQAAAVAHRQRLT